MTVPADSMHDRRPLAVPVLTSMVLLGSFLSFGMEPLIGRLVVPYYGGSVHVWTTCMMTFQGLLLLGYAYAHLVAPRIGAAHLLLLLLPFVQWPLGFSSAVAPDAPIVALVMALMRSVALPFAVLTTTAVVAQSWWARSVLEESDEPWWLYGASNLGSLAALIGYPLLIEPFVGLSAQARGWSALYVVYALLAASAWMLLRPSAAALARPVKAAGARSAHVGLWSALAAAPSALLLATTNQVAHEVGSFPLVWVVPLALYLGSFIVAFRDREGALVRASRSWILMVAAQVVMFAAFRGQASLLVLAASLVPFTLLCVASHRLLYELRPEVDQLTSFYLWVAFGGWIGGTVVTLGAPTLLPGLYEPFLACAGVALALGSASRRAGPRWRAWGEDVAVARRYAAYGAVLLAIALVDRSAILHGNVREWSRNFYGTYRIEDIAATSGSPASRRMLHGGTVHGLELLEGDAGHSGAYYYPGSPLSQVIAARREGPARVGVIGLGAGAMAWTVDADDALVYYEIDSDTEVLARRWFTFLESAKVPVEVRLGDARLSLHEERERGEAPYDVLVVDAFSGDGIPMHLATLEAWQVYLRRLAGDGILAMHVSNRYYDLRPVLAKLAEVTRLHGVYAHGNPSDGNRDGKAYDVDLPSEVVAFSPDPQRLQPLLAKGWRPLAEGVGSLPEHPWTDDFASVLTALR